MKGVGGEKQGRGSRLPVPQLEASPLFRQVFIAVGCFLAALVFLFSSHLDGAVVLDILSPKTPLPAPAADETLLRSPAEHEVANTDTTAAAVGTADGVVKEAEIEAEPEESSAGAGDATAADSQNSDDRRGAAPGPGAAAEEEEVAVEDNAVHVTEEDAAQPAAGTTSSPPPHGLPGNTGAATTTRADHVVDRRPLCDLSGFRADVCDLTGDVRLDAKASTFLVVVDPADVVGTNATATTYKVQPYPRKNDKTAMGRVTKLTVRTATTTSSSSDASLPRCTATHAAPAVVFSVGGYAGNVFHDYSDVIVPLYTAARRFDGDVHLVATDAAAGRWLARYGALLRALSRHAVVDLAAAARDGETHCFPRAVVGIHGHREMLIEPGRPWGGGASMPDFSLFLRRALALPRDAPTRLGTSTKPRLLIIARRRTRKLLNVDAAARAASDVGFEAVALDLDPGHDISEVGRLVNSFDAVVGVHGAGLTNMVFLPPGATLVQVVPWGGLQWLARLDFGDPAEAMGIRYVQYEVRVDESTLKDKYPRDHQIFTDPTALHKKGFKFLRQTILNGQDIVLDIDRFTAVLRQIRDSLPQ